MKNFVLALALLAAAPALAGTDPIVKQTNGWINAGPTGTFAKMDDLGTVYATGFDSLVAGALNFQGTNATSFTFADAATTGNAFSITANSLTTGNGLLVTSSGTLTSGGFIESIVGSGATTGTLLSLTGAALTSGFGEVINANALTTGAALSIPHTTSVIASGGSLIAASSTSIDTGTTTGNLLDLSASASVAGTLARIAASNASQTTETALAVTQSGTTAGYTGKFVNLTCTSTTGSGACESITGAETTAGSALLVTTAGHTTGTAGAVAITGTSVTSGSLLTITGSSDAVMTNAGAFINMTDGTGGIRFGVDSHMTELVGATAPTVGIANFSSVSCSDGAGTAAKCTDGRGQMRFTPTADTTNAVLTFHTAYAVAPTCVVTAANAGAQVDIIKAGFFVATATNTLTLTAPAANWANTAKVFNYVCIE